MLKVGEEIGKWRVDRVLGEGGMGAVFACTDNMTGRIRAAVKVAKSHGVDDHEQRFLREVEALHSLQHRAIVRVNDWGKERGLLFMAMDLLDGMDLEGHLRSGALDLEVARKIFDDVTDGLAHAHKIGIHHRDLKPANIMVTSTGQAKLVDFGIAVQEGQSRLTEAGQLPGTPAYLDPVVLTGTVDAAKGDIYAMGQIIYEALTGTEAFPEARGLSTTHQMMHVVAAKSKADPLDIGEGFPDALRNLLWRATHPDPNERPVDAFRFSEELRLAWDNGVVGADGSVPPGAERGALPTMPMSTGVAPEAIAAAAVPAHAPPPSAPSGGGGSKLMIAVLILLLGVGGVGLAAVLIGGGGALFLASARSSDDDRSSRTGAVDSDTEAEAVVDGEPDASVDAEVEVEVEAEGVPEAAQPEDDNAAAPADEPEAAVEAEATAEVESEAEAEAEAAPSTAPATSGTLSRPVNGAVPPAAGTALTRPGAPTAGLTLTYGTMQNTGRQGKTWVDKPLLRRKDDLLNCYAAVADRDPAASGTFKITYTIKMNGRVEYAKVKQLGNDQMRQCIQGVLQSMRYSSRDQGGPLYITYTWVYSKS